MAITSYCKKCGQDVPRGEVCPQCGAKLPKTSARVVWSISHRPVLDWMCWNAALRIMAPAAGAVLVMILLLEGLSGGWAAAERLLTQGLLWTWATLCAASLVVLWLILLAQGHDVQDCVVDSKGVHVTTWLMNPTPLSLLARLRSPALMRQAVQSENGTMLALPVREISWREISRVQLWPPGGCGWRCRAARSSTLRCWNLCGIRWGGARICCCRKSCGQRPGLASRAPQKLRWKVCLRKPAPHLNLPHPRRKRP